MNKNLLIILTIIFFQFGQSQEIDLSNWTKDSIPFGKKLNKANHSENHWFFNKINDTVFIEKYRYQPIKGDSLPFSIDSIKGIKGNDYIKSVHNGFLIGRNGGGFFGGGLKYVSLNNEYSYNIEMAVKENGWKNGYSGNNIKKIFEFNDKIYATNGLARLALNFGNIIEIIFEGGKWKYKHILRLIESPALTLEHNKFIYIITSQYILKLNKEINISQVLKAPFYWGVLYPSSAFIKDKDIYVAMRKGILIIRDFENNPNYEWYVK